MSGSPSAAAPSAPALSATVSRLRAAGCVFAEEEARLLHAEARTSKDLAALVGRRESGLPLEQVLGWAEFCGRRVRVEPGVFVPRRRTEHLVREAVALARSTHRLGRTVEGRDRTRHVVVDLCCGSGAVGLALLSALDHVELYAVDVDPAAVRCARANLEGVGARVYEGDLDAPLPSALRGGVDLLVANAPYVPSDAVAMMPPEARTHEAQVALDGGADGLGVVRRVATVAPGWLAPGGNLLVETGRDQAAQAAGIFAARGLVPRISGCEDLGATVVVGTNVGARGDRSGSGPGSTGDRPGAR